jgi:hypothetical protein
MRYFNTGKRTPNYGALSRVYSFQNRTLGNLGSTVFFNQIFTGNVLGKPEMFDLIIFIFINNKTEKRNDDILKNEISNIKGYKIIVEIFDLQTNHLEVFDDITTYYDDSKRKLIIIDKNLVENLENSSDKSLEKLEITYFPYDNSNENMNKTVMSQVYSILFSLQEDKFKI